MPSILHISYTFLCFRFDYILANCKIACRAIKHHCRSKENGFTGLSCSWKIISSSLKDRNIRWSERARPRGLPRANRFQDHVPGSRTPRCIPEEPSSLNRSYTFHKFPSPFAQVRVFSRAPAGQRPDGGNKLLTTLKSCWSVRPISWSFCRTQDKNPAEGGPLKPTTSRRRSEESRRERIFALLSPQRAWLDRPR